MYGLIAIPLCAPLFGVALAGPIQELVAASYRGMRSAALQELQGRHYVHRGHSIDIAEDEDGTRWVLVSDVRKIARDFPSDAELKQVLQGQGGAGGAARGLRVRADTLADCLRASRQPDSIKFKTWLEREVVFPMTRKQGKPLL